MTYEIDLSGKTAFVTGGTRGIGLKIATRLIQAGVAKIALGYRSNQTTALAAVSELKKVNCHVDITTIESDLSIDASAREMASQAVAALGGSIDIVVLNAAIGGGGDLDKTPIDTWRAPFETNVFGHVALLQELSGKINSGGSVVFISSGAGHDPLAGLSAYGASKAAVNQVAMILSQEWGPRGVRVNVVSPGRTATSPIDYAKLTDNQKETIEGTALRRLGTSDDVADTVLFFGSDLSSFVTGQWVRVNGGRV